MPDDSSNNKPPYLKFFDKFFSFVDGPVTVFRGMAIIRSLNGKSYIIVRNVILSGSGSGFVAPELGDNMGSQDE